MGMIFCRGCGVQIHEDASACPHCGAPQVRPAMRAESEAKSPWVAWTALVFSLVAANSLFADALWKRDEVVGAGIAGAIAIALAAISLAQKRPGRVIAIVAIVAGVVGFLAAVGHLN